MRYIALLTLAASSLALQAQTPGAYTVETTRVSAQLTSKVDTKKAKVGDQVSAKTTSDTRLYDGTKLSKGTKLTGQVTEVHAKSSDDKTSHLAFSLNRAILHDGHEVPVHATLAAIAPPAPIATSSDSDGISGGGGMGGGGAGGGHGGGSMAGGTAQTASEAELQGVRPVVSNVGSSVYSTTALQLNHVPIAGMPGVTLTTSAGATSAGALDANGHDITLQSGAQLTLDVSAAPQ